MSEVSKNLMCISMRNGVQIWAEKERVESLQRILKNLKSHIFVNYDNQTVNTADVVGIFTADTMSDNTRRKNGEWLCQHNIWHDKYEKCDDICKLKTILKKEI